MGGATDNLGQQNQRTPHLQSGTGWLFSATVTKMSKPTPRIIAYLKPTCGWSNGVRAVLRKYQLPFEDRDIINNPANYAEMVAKSGQPLQPTLDIDGHIVADVSGEELERWLIHHGYVQPSSASTDVPTNAPCAHEMPSVSFGEQK